MAEGSEEHRNSVQGVDLEQRLLLELAGADGCGEGGDGGGEESGPVVQARGGGSADPHVATPHSASRRSCRGGCGKETSSQRHQQLQVE